VWEVCLACDVFPLPTLLARLSSACEARPLVRSYAHCSVLSFLVAAAYSRKTGPC